MSNKVIGGIGEHDVHVGSPDYDPRKGPPPRWRMPVAGLSMDQRRTFGEATSLCGVTGEPLEVGSGALAPRDQARVLLARLEASWDLLRDRIASEQAALGNLQRDAAAPKPATPGFVFVRPTELDLQRQQDLVDTLIKERDFLTARIRTAREKLKAEE